MKLNAYTLYDEKSLTYSPPFFAVSHGAATRMLGDLVADPNTTPGRHPKDFTLYCIGTFDDALGLLLQSDPRQHIVDAISLVPERPGPRDLFTPFASAPEMKPNGQS